jgi:hypothetical protein
MLMVSNKRKFQQVVIAPELFCPFKFVVRHPSTPISFRANPTRPGAGAKSGLYRLRMATASPRARRRKLQAIQRRNLDMSNFHFCLWT